MDHTEAREILDGAAVEPDGLARLAAGDTPEAAALAGHLAGCPDCAAEMERLRRSSELIRAAIRSLPPADLRDRTLALVEAAGRERGPRSVATPPAAVPGERRRRIVTWVGLAAALVVAVTGTALLVGAPREALIAAQAEEVASLAKVATWTLRIDGREDARHVDLTSPSGAAASGTLVFSPGSTELVVLAEGLPRATAGMEYRCWVEVDGRRMRVGRMFPGGDVAYWVGEVAVLAGTGEGTRFGVSLVPAGGDSLAGDPVLVGEL